MAITVREMIIKTLMNFKVTYDPKVIDGLEQNVYKTTPQKPLHYANVITRHKAIDMLRHEDYMKRKKWKEALKEEKWREQLQKIASAKKEFDLIVITALQETSPRTRATAKRNINILKERIFKRKKIKDIQKQYPRCSIFLIRQALKRARTLLRPYASTNLQMVISRGCWRRRRRKKR